MRRRDRIFSERDRAAINQAIQEAESQTSAEIVPVVAASSGRYDRPEDVVGVWLALIAMLVVWAIYPPPDSMDGSWKALPIWQFVALAAAVVVGFVLGAFVGSRIDWLRRLFTPPRQMREEVFSRARSVFFDHRVHHTSGSSGVLLYVSLFERMAAVIADQTVIDKLGQERIDAICSEFAGRLHQSNPTNALSETARAVGHSLAAVLPRAGNDVNELADALVVMD